MLTKYHLGKDRRSDIANSIKYISLPGAREIQESNALYEVKIRFPLLVE